MNPDDHQDNIPSRSYTYSLEMRQWISHATSVHHVTQAALVSDRVTNGVSPATVAGLPAMLAQMESQTQAALLSVTFTLSLLWFPALDDLSKWNLVWPRSNASFS